MSSSSVQIHGLAQVVKALKQVDEEIVRDIKDELEKAGELVRRDARRRFEAYDRFSAQGFKTSARPTSVKTTVSIRQNIRRTTGNHPEWGALQMTKALLPARAHMMPEVARQLDHMLDRVLKLHGF